MKEFLSTVKEILVILSLVSLLWSSCDAKKSNERLAKEVVGLRNCVERK